MIPIRNAGFRFALHNIRIVRDLKQEMMEENTRELNLFSLKN